MLQYLVRNSFLQRNLDARPGLFGAEEVGICNFTRRCCRDFQDQQSVVVISCSLPVRPRFIFRNFISRKLVEMGPNSPPQPGRFVSCCGHVPSVRFCFTHFTTNLGALPTPWGWSFVPPYVQWRCQQASEGKRRHGILMYFGQIRSYFIPYVKET